MTITKLKQSGRYLGFVPTYGFIYEVPTQGGYGNQKYALYNGTITPYTGTTI